jgi:hypothetical protein
VVLMLAEQRDRDGGDVFDGADRVIDVVSDDGPARDLVTKRGECARRHPHMLVGCPGSGAIGARTCATLTACCRLSSIIRSSILEVHP